MDIFKSKVCCAVISPLSDENEALSFLYSINKNFKVEFINNFNIKEINVYLDGKSISLLSLFEALNLKFNYSFVEDNDGSSINYFFDDTFLTSLYQNRNSKMEGNKCFEQEHLLPFCRIINDNLYYMEDENNPIIFGCFNPA